MRKNVQFALWFLATSLVGCAPDEPASMNGGMSAALGELECESHPDGTATCGPHPADDSEASFTCKVMEDRSIICWSLPEKQDGDGECRDLPDGRTACGYFLDDGVIVVCKYQQDGTVACGVLADRPGEDTWQPCVLDAPEACPDISSCVASPNEASSNGVCLVPL